MATEINKDTGEITTDDDWFWVVNDQRPATVKVSYTTVGSGGSTAIKDAQGDPYIKDSSAITVAYNASGTAEMGFVLDPTGGRINFTTSGLVAGSSGVTIKVIQPEGQ